MRGNQNATRSCRIKAVTHSGHLLGPFLLLHALGPKELRAKALRRLGFVTEKKLLAPAVAVSGGA